MSNSEFERRSLVNETRARELLRRLGADAFVAAQPVHVYYFTNFWTILAKMGFDHASMALWTPSPEHRTLVASAAQIWRLALEEVDYPPHIIACTAPANWQAWLDSDGRTELLAAPATPWPVTRDVELSAIEQAWLAASHRIEGREAANAEAGLARAIRNAGLERGCIVTDDAAIEPALRRHGQIGRAHV